MKSDIRSFNDLSDSYKSMLQEVSSRPDEHSVDADDYPRPCFFEMSTLTESGLIQVRARACDELLALRVQAKLRAGAVSSSAMDSEEGGGIANRLYVAKPKPKDTKSSDLSSRPPIIPTGVLDKRQKARKRTYDKMVIDGEEETLSTDLDLTQPTVTRRTMRDRELEAGNEIFILNLREHWKLANPAEANDVIPEIMDGHNLIDYFDPDIEERLDSLEKQEAALEAAGFYEECVWRDPDAENPEMQSVRKTASKIRQMRALRVLETRERKHKKNPQLPRTARSVSVNRMREELGERGQEVDMQAEGERGRSRKLAIRSRTDSLSNPHRDASIARASLDRSRSAVRDEPMYKQVKRMASLAQRKVVHLSRRGEGDRHIPTLKPKHLFAGKRSNGKTDRR